MNKNNDYFPELDLIRFFSSIMVVYCHVIILKYYLYPYLENKPDFIYQFGKFLMGGFFAQSGFLITHFLLKEKESKNKINVYNFFIKRIFRIWPLYILLALACLFILPKFYLFYIPEQSEQLTANISLKSLFLFSFQPQSQYLLFNHPVPGAEQLWSIGVEEIFYLIIPFIIFNVMKRKKLLIITMLIILFVRLFSYQLAGIYSGKSISLFFYNIFLFFYYTRLECLLVGALTALLVNDSNFLLKTKKYYKFKFIVFLLLLFLISFFTYKTINIFDYFFYSILFCFYFIFSFQRRDYFTQNSKLQFIQFLGKLTYPIYIIHYIIIIALFNFSGWKNTTLIFIIGFPITLFCSILIYFVIERPIQKLRDLLLE